MQPYSLLSQQSIETLGHIVDVTCTHSPPSKHNCDMPGWNRTSRRLSTLTSRHIWRRLHMRLPEDIAFVKCTIKGSGDRVGGSIRLLYFADLDEARNDEIVGLVRLCTALKRLEAAVVLPKPVTTSTFLSQIHTFKVFDIHGRKISGHLGRSLASLGSLKHLSIGVSLHMEREVPPPLFHLKLLSWGDKPTPTAIHWLLQSSKDSLKYLQFLRCPVYDNLRSVAANTERTTFH
ncbi:hypothetical protein FRB94_005282 [Tulasnella sp. JGI-2019a]|nr:hypothetical protein FRB94_005282 [Tulasnella sp. JGI-2019a]